MLADVVSFLACPVCGCDVALTDGAVRCEEGHSFDVARQGYAGMLPGGSPHRGDDAAMVAARTRFLGAGHFDPIADAVAAAASAGPPPPPGCVVDVGAGTGHYLARVLDELRDRAGAALDASAPALRRAARCHPRAGAVAADVWTRWPLRTGAAGVLLNVFAPRNGAEMHRVLAPGGRLVVVSPRAEHLRELVSALDLLNVDEDKAERLGEKLGQRFAEVASEHVEHVMELTRAEVADVVAMGPSARHASPDPTSLAEPVRVTASVTVATYAPRP